MSNALLVKNYIADGAIPAYTIVKQNAADDHIVAAAAATDLFIGVTMELAAATNERADVQMLGIAYVVAGAAVTRGNRVTADASGRAVAAAPAGGVNNVVIGTALESATAAGDVIRVLLGLSTIQG